MDNPIDAKWLESNPLGGDERHVLRKVFKSGGRYPQTRIVKDFPPDFQLAASGEVLLEGTAGRYVLERLLRLKLIVRKTDTSPLYPLTDLGAQVAGVLELSEGGVPSNDQNAGAEA